MLNMGMKKPKATSEATRGCRSFTPKSSNHFIGDLLGTRKHHRQYLVDGVEVPIVVPALELADVPGQVLRRHPVVDAHIVQNKVEAPMRGRTCSSGDGG